MQFLMFHTGYCNAANDYNGPTFSIHERHSFSLTTFDSKGILEQVEYAMMATSMGTPIIACILPKQNTIYLILSLSIQQKEDFICTDKPCYQG